MINEAFSIRNAGFVTPTAVFVSGLHHGLRKHPGGDTTFQQIATPARFIAHLA